MWCGAAAERTTSSRDTPGLSAKNRTRLRAGAEMADADQRS